MDAFGSSRLPLLLAIVLLVGAHGARVDVGINRTVQHDKLVTPPSLARKDPMVLCCCQSWQEETCGLTQHLERSSSKLFEGEPMCSHKDGFYDYSAFQTQDFIPAKCSAGVKPPPRTDKIVTVKAYWMRHGWSCANALSEQGKGVIKGTFLERKWAKAAALKFVLYEDPGLTDAAIARAVVMSKRIRNTILKETGGASPLVFSSPMVRAVETAYWNFPEWKVRPIPYIAESGSGYDNTPLAFDAQKEKLNRQPNPYSELMDRVTFDVNSADNPDRSNGYKSDYSKFLSYFPGVLAELLKDEEALNGTVEGSEGVEIPVIIVGHSSYMLEYLQCGGHLGMKPRNNEVWVQKYEVNLGAPDAPMKQVGCETLIDTDYYPNPPAKLCQADVDRCGWKPDAWLDQDAQECEEGGNLNIVDRDMKTHEAYVEQL